MIFDTMASLSTRKRSVRRGIDVRSRESIVGSFTRRVKKTSVPKHRLQLPGICLLALLCVTFSWITTSLISPAKSNMAGSSFLRRPPLMYQKRRVQKVQVDGSISELQRKFPIHVNDDDVEEIPHPGIAYSGSDRIKILLPGYEFPETLSVPKFWNPNQYGPRGVREFLGNHGRRRMTPKEAQSIGSYVDGEEETIFVSVASYRDSECRPTVESIFLRAEHPERIRVAVVDQVEPDDSKCAEPIVSCTEDPEQVLCKYRHLIDVHEVRSYLMVGPVLARHIAHRMYRNEYFAMQVDAHVRFAQGWDDDIISQWKSADNEMAVITTYLTDIADSIDPVTHASLRVERNMMCVLSYEGQERQSHLVLKAPVKSVPKVRGTPMLHPFWSAGFSFARGHFVVQVPYDQHLPMVFMGEESSIAIRAFTYGYDFYAPERSVTFHIFAIKENIGRRKRHKFWENETLYAGALEKSMARISGMTGMAGPAKTPQQDYYRVDEELYGLGHIRTKEHFFRTFGIHPDTTTVENHLCSFVKETMHHQFSNVIRHDGMGVDYDEIDFEFKDPSRMGLL